MELLKPLNDWKAKPKNLSYTEIPSLSFPSLASLDVRGEQLVRTYDPGRQTLFVDILADSLQRRAVDSSPYAQKTFPMTRQVSSM